MPNLTLLITAHSPTPENSTVLHNRLAHVRIYMCGPHSAGHMSTVGYV